MSAPTPDEIRDRYRATFGAVPAGIERRLALGEATDRAHAVGIVEELRETLLARNPLDAKTQQLVHFAQLVALGHTGPARLHARAAARNGATLAELVGVAETSLVTSGMPAYSLAIDVIAELAEESA